MTKPQWLALPPEIPSALLSAGPGAGPLLAAAQSWLALSAEYDLLAGELDDLLETVRAGLWEGEAAERYLGVHRRYALWLRQMSAVGVRAAARHEAAAAAYITALVAMPTLAELAANHAHHATLTATNFFGLNTIAIALNEADYVRMWLQAAETMQAYQAAADAVLVDQSTTVWAPELVGRSDFTPDGDDEDDPLAIKELVRRMTDIYHLLFDGPFDEIAQVLSSALPGLAAVAAGTSPGDAGAMPLISPGTATAPIASVQPLAVPVSSTGGWSSVPTAAASPVAGAAGAPVPGPGVAASVGIGAPVGTAQRRRDDAPAATAGPDSPGGPTLTDAEKAPAAPVQVASAPRERARPRRRRSAEQHEERVATKAMDAVVEPCGPQAQRRDVASRAKGLTRHGHDGHFETALTLPMLPASWPRSSES